MSDNYLNVTFDIVGEPEPQPAQVRPTLTVNALIAEIAREFSIANPEQYQLYMDGADTPLKRNLSLDKQNVRSNQQLLFGHPALLRRRPIQAKEKAQLIHKSGRSFEIQWQPAIIGRPDTDPVHSGLLAVDLKWAENARYISRSHAQITEDEGTYYIEPLASNNPTFVNGNQLALNEKSPLKQGDKIYLRSSRTLLEFSLQK